MSRRCVAAFAPVVPGVLLAWSLTSPTPLPAQQPVPPAAPASASAPDPGFVVHEWGTFTSMLGEDGAVLDGLQREEEALPAFVHDLLHVEDAGPAQVKFPASHVTQKMETPVVYFHTDRPRSVRVHVWFERGLVSQFHPLPDQVFPPLDTLQPRLRNGTLDLRTLERSGLIWDVDLVPPDQGPPVAIEPVAADDPWALARDVDAAYVRTRPQVQGARVEAEHYLFYRGIGRWQPPLQLRQTGDGAVRLHNASDGDVPFAALLEFDDRGGRFAIGGALPPGGERTLSAASAPFTGDRALLAEQLAAAVHRALVDAGLFDDEARAMVATWSRSWFQHDGARVLWILPRTEVDRVLPMWIDPPPRELVRVLVGRLEFATTRARLALEQALRDGDEAALRRLDRFLEPHLRNVAASTDDAAVRALAGRRLATMAR